MFVAAIFFFGSFLGIIVIFGLKYWERRTERTLAPAFREKIDVRALQLKELLTAVRMDLAKLPPALVRLSRFFVHETALGFAFLARIAEKQSYRLADLVSHKHRFEKRETRSEFLKKVSEHKNGAEQREVSGSDAEL
jgi:hypothetical protein